MIEMQDLKVIQKYVKLTTLCKDTALPYSGIISRMNNNNELSTVESKQISEALAEVGLSYNREMYNNRQIAKGGEGI